MLMRRAISVNVYGMRAVAATILVISALSACSRSDTDADQKRLTGLRPEILKVEPPPVKSSQIFALIGDANSRGRAIELIQSGSVTNVRDWSGDTPLHAAVRVGDIGLADELLKLKDLELDATNKADRTAVMLAAENGNIALVKKLISAGANPRLATSEGPTAIALASEAGKTEIVRYLKSLGIDDSEVKQKSERKRQMEVGDLAYRRSRSPELGMSKNDVVDGPLGYPDSINSSKGRWGVHEQWVYRGKVTLYFENEILKSMQY